MCTVYFFIYIALKFLPTILCMCMHVDRMLHLFAFVYSIVRAFLVSQMVKNISACNVRDTGLILWVGKIPWNRKWQPIPVFLSGKYHGQRSLESYSPRDCKESDMTEQLTHITL